MFEKLKTLNNPMSFDKPATSEEILEYQKYDFMPVWIEENFSGDKSDVYYAGLLAGYLRGLELYKLCGNNFVLWSYWMRLSIIFLVNRLPSEEVQQEVNQKGMFWCLIKELVVWFITYLRYCRKKMSSTNSKNQV